MDDERTHEHDTGGEDVDELKLSQNNLDDLELDEGASAEVKGGVGATTINAGTLVGP